MPFYYIIMFDKSRKDMDMEICDYHGIRTPWIMAIALAIFIMDFLYSNSKRTEITWDANSDLFCQ